MASRSSRRCSQHSDVRVSGPFCWYFPLLAFVVVTFIFPILQMLHNSMYNPGFVIHRDVETKVETPIMINLQQWFRDNPAGTACG